MKQEKWMTKKTIIEAIKVAEKDYYRTCIMYLTKDVIPSFKPSRKRIEELRELLRNFKKENEQK